MNDSQDISVDNGSTEPVDALQTRRRKSKKRAMLATGSLLVAGALFTAASMSDFAILDLFGAGGAGGEKFDIQVSKQQENKLEEVKTWVQANPQAETLEIPDAAGLVPGGKARYIRIPVKNVTESVDANIKLTFQNTTDGSAADAAYADLMRFDYTIVDDATELPAALPGSVDSVPSGFTRVPKGNFANTKGGETSQVNLGSFPADGGHVLVVRVQLENGADQDATNAANGGRAVVQARLDASSLDKQ
ncbi:hypothetical protein K8P10_001936 [Leucobacter sp. Psy1]|uniref:hypothetical protein n=1 Tax=Leucobacter sp. Psy1 TaxID=2875729 RepID=UPI001CD1F66E|nr:hypothetical protein [Leucobacter sp. Psy1]UBH06425.1 hypothetical protein K8P10_001936 [Leucobacter sp. Psy1]